MLQQIMLRFSENRAHEDLQKANWQHNLCNAPVTVDLMQTAREVVREQTSHQVALAGQGG